MSIGKREEGETGKGETNEIRDLPSLQLLCTSYSTATLSHTDLWDDGDSGAQVRETNGVNTDVVHFYGSPYRLNDPEQGQSEGRLPCTSSTHYAHLHTQGEADNKYPCMHVPSEIYKHVSV